MVALPGSHSAQELAKRLILKDGSYQSVTKYESQGRTRSLYQRRARRMGGIAEVDGRLARDREIRERSRGGRSTPEAAELDKELEADRQAEEARSPHVAPGLQLPEEGGVFLLDTYESRPELVPLDQRGGAVNKNMKGNILRSAVNPIASARQTVEVPGKRSPVQAARLRARALHQY